MSSNAAASRERFIKGVGIGSFVLGLIFIIAGIGTWTLVSTTLAKENITLSEDAPFLVGNQVRGPFSAYAQAEVIDLHANAASDGLTYSELGAAVNEARAAGDEELATELQATRNTVMNASFLKSSLFTSVLAFGVSAMVIGLGVLLAFVGVVLRQLSVGFQPKETKVVKAEPAAATE